MHAVGFRLPCPMACSRLCTTQLNSSLTSANTSLALTEYILHSWSEVTSPTDHTSTLIDDPVPVHYNSARTFVIDAMPFTDRFSYTVSFVRKQSARSNAHEHNIKGNQFSVLPLY